MDKRSGLVERREIEGNTELHRRHSEGAFHMRVRGVERRDVHFPPSNVRTRGERIPDCMQPLSMPHRLPIRSALAGNIQITTAQLTRIEVKQRCAAAQQILYHQHALRSTEPPERRLRCLVGLGDPSVDFDVGNVVGVVYMAERPGQHRFGEIQAPAAVAGQGGGERLEAAVVVEPCLPARMERMPLAGHGDVLGAVEA